MEISWLEDFKALVECLNFSRAAEIRNVTQPAFSRRVRALENWIGTPLFDRDTHRLRLTPAGEKFRLVAEEVLRRLQQGRQEALDAGSAASSLRFISTHALSLSFFPHWLREIEPVLGSTTVRLMADNMQGCERRMLQGEAHFLLCHHHPAAAHRLNSQDYISIHLGDDMLVPISAPDDLGQPRHRLPGRPDEPTAYLAFSEESGMGRIITAARAHGGRPAWLKPVFASHLSHVLRMFAADGRGMTWSPYSLTRDDMAAGKLVRAGDESWDIPMQIRLFRPRTRQDAQAERFWSYLEDRQQKPQTDRLPHGTARRHALASERA
ncbi:MAG TPA: LysR family transcriptional regulator [Ferrovibrio sp.]|uniref:LysR family transcriptional regulator n=1 Tax=Ferrovibrio sp. TaxID=1917215 RepID=UPI002ED0740B